MDICVRMSDYTYKELISYTYRGENMHRIRANLKYMQRRKCWQKKQVGGKLFCLRKAKTPIVSQRAALVLLNNSPVKATRQKSGRERHWLQDERDEKVSCKTFFQREGPRPNQVEGEIRSRDQFSFRGEIRKQRKRRKIIKEEKKYLRKRENQPNIRKTRGRQTDTMEFLVKSDADIFILT